MSWHGARAAINSGRVIRDPANGNWIVNGKTHGMHANGTLFRASVPGIHQASRKAYRALGAYSEFGGLTAEALGYIERYKLSPQAAAGGLRLYGVLGR